MEYDGKDWQRFSATPAVRCFPTDNVLLYHKDTVHLTPLPHIIRFRPSSGDKAAYTMDQPADIADTLWRRMLDTPYCQAKKAAPRPLAPGADAGISLLRCPPADAYTGQNGRTPQKRPSPSDDNTQPKKRRRDGGEPNTATTPQSPTQPTKDIRRWIGDFDDVVPAMCDKMDELSKRLHSIKQAKRFLDSPVDMSDEFRQKILDGYDADPRWSRVRRQLREEGNDPVTPTLPYLIEDEFLYSVQDDGSHWLCIPTSLAKDVFQLVHDEQGHQGFDRCRRKMDGMVFHKGMKLLKQYIDHCPECLRNNTRRHRPYRSLQPIVGPPIPFHTLTETGRGPSHWGIPIVR
ncbi:hypothetical protein PENPOL_c025G02991 [Penicillium polonicum]|uniref:Integrase zinc-binding domain-containing protein n=1 Tax=Penicillium polonicum TaxID=60169 RepID=A0A1V6N6J5_PENPO|nr:hypothetical protein PENPOL_c025G02991 [Penicillium polonicum]